MSSLSYYLVVGSGSMARRHIANLKILFPNSIVGCISASGKALKPADVGADVIYENLHEAMKHPLTFAIVATPAPFHVSQAVVLLKRDIPVLIEKPLSDSLAQVKRVADFLYSKQNKIEIAYNLRYMPSALCLKKLLEQNIIGKPKGVVIDVGQFLPDWRPQKDYKEYVSAKKSLGGGVLLELSHEFDYLMWFFGKFEKVCCMMMNSGILNIDVEDIASVLLTRQNGPIVNIHMDFLQRQPTRTCKIIGELGTLNWNILKDQVVICLKSQEETVVYENPNYDRNRMYLDELTRFAKVAAGELSPAVSLQQGLEVLTLVEAMKRSARSQQLITLGQSRTVLQEY